MIQLIAVPKARERRSNRRHRETVSAENNGIYLT